MIGCSEISVKFWIYMGSTVTTEKAHNLSKIYFKP
jgi:hypothetical protein